MWFPSSESQKIQGVSHFQGRLLLVSWTLNTTMRFGGGFMDTLCSSSSDVFGNTIRSATPMVWPWGNQLCRGILLYKAVSVAVAEGDWLARNMKGPEIIDIYYKMQLFASKMTSKINMDIQNYPFFFLMNKWTVLSVPSDVEIIYHQCSPSIEPQCSSKEHSSRIHVWCIQKTYIYHESKLRDSLEPGVGKFYHKHQLSNRMQKYQSHGSYVGLLLLSELQFFFQSPITIRCNGKIKWNSHMCRMYEIFTYNWLRFMELSGLDICCNFGLLSRWFCRILPW